MLSFHLLPRLLLLAIHVLDDSTAVTGSNDGTVKFWNVSPDCTGSRCRSTLVAHAQVRLGRYCKTGRGSLPACLV